MNQEKQINGLEDAIVDCFAVNEMLCSLPDGITSYEDNCRAVEQIKKRLKTGEVWLRVYRPEGSHGVGNTTIELSDLRFDVLKSLRNVLDEFIDQATDIEEWEALRPKHDDGEKPADPPARSGRKEIRDGNHKSEGI
jgi:hypothetical protein